MIPRLFESTHTHNSTSFQGHGLGELIDAIEVTAEENVSDGHEWELTFKYPENGEMFPQLILNRIVVAKANGYQEPQAFRIYSISKSFDRTVSVSCQHISYDLTNTPVKPFNKLGTRESLLSLKSGMFDDPSGEAQRTYGKNFTFSTDIPDPIVPDPEPETWREQNTVSFTEPKSARAVLLDGDDSILYKSEGDIVVNNFSISIVQNGGRNRGESIDYGVDLTDLQQERNITDMITGVLPYYVKEDNSSIDVSTKNDHYLLDNSLHMYAVTRLESDAIKIEPGWRYTITFVPVNSGGYIQLNQAYGISSSRFLMDGKQKQIVYEVPDGGSSITIHSINDSGHSSDYLFASYDALDGSGNVTGKAGTIMDLHITKEPKEPIVYGNICTRNTNGYNYQVPRYEVPRISPVNVTGMFGEFEDENHIPTIEEVTAKGQEYVNRQKVGVPKVSLTVSYADIGDKDIRIHDTVQINFVKMGVVTSDKVTRIKYDTLSERIIELDIGKTRESPAATFQNASRLRRGSVSPDRLADKSIGASKIKNGSIGGAQLSSLGGGGWKLPPDWFNDEVLKQKVGTDDLKTGGWHKDPVLVSVPENVYGGYDRKVGYLFDPSLGVPPEGMFGWTETDSSGNKRFHSAARWKSVSEFANGMPVPGGGSGVGFVLDPDFVFDSSIDAERKVSDGSVVEGKIRDSAVTGNKIRSDSVNTRHIVDMAVKTSKLDDGSVNTSKLGDGAVTEDKLEDGAVTAAIYAHNSERKLKAWLNLYDGVGPEAVPIGSDTYMRVPFMEITRQLLLSVGVSLGFETGGATRHMKPSRVFVDGFLMSNSYGDDLYVLANNNGADIDLYSRAV